MWILLGEGKRGRPNLQALYFGQRQCLPHFYPNGEISETDGSYVSLIWPALEPRDVIDMDEYRFTEYFETNVLRKRPYIRKEWCIYVLQNAVRSEPQERNRHRFWATISELDGRYLRVVTLEDRVTIHNAFPDRRFKP